MTGLNSRQTLIKQLNLEDRVGNERVRRYVLQCSLATLVVLALLWCSLEPWD